MIVKQDLYLLLCHPSAGNALYHHFHKESGLQMMGLKLDDPNIEKTSREVEATKKEVASSTKKNNHSVWDRGREHAPSSKQYTGRVYDQHGRGGFSNREHSTNGGDPYYNSHRDSYNDYRDGRGGYHSGNFNGHFQNNYSGNSNVVQGQQNDPNNPQTRMLGWIPQG